MGTYILLPYWVDKLPGQGQNLLFFIHLLSRKERRKERRKEGRKERKEEREEGRIYIYIYIYYEPPPPFPHIR